MGQTDEFDLPWPEGDTGLVKDGDDSIRALAESIEALIISIRDKRMPYCLLQLGPSAIRGDDIEVSLGAGDGESAYWIEVDDVDGLHDAAANRDRITFNEPGIWLVGNNALWTPAAAGRAIHRVLQGAANLEIINFYMNLAPGAGNYHPGQVRALRVVAAGDYVRATAMQNTGANQTLESVAKSHTLFWAAKVGNI